MCNSKIKSSHAIDGRPVLQPACNRVAAPPDAARPLKKSLQRSLSSPITISLTTTNNINASEAFPIISKKLYSPPISPKPKPVKRGNDPNSLNSSTEKPATPKKSVPLPIVRKKSKKSLTEPPTTASVSIKNPSPPYESSPLHTDRAPGSIAAAHKEQASLAQAQRKMRIAHYGRTPAKAAVAPVETAAAAAGNQEEKRCSFITPNSDPLYVAYHDEEWGVPVHDDNMLFELLVLSGLQVGLDWTTILKKRNEFRSAFAGFDAETVARFTERQIGSISTDYGVDLGKVRGVVDNSNRILEVRKEFGSFAKYLWGFVNHKPIPTNYKCCRKIPAKTAKSESMSKDMVRRGFRLVGPTVVHSFMQAVGLTNDHLVSCPRHLHCSAAAAAALN
ncbi:uncharacterized protein M6B38_417350 [Iris pallida]|uniref:DNA-3-methyladenine glycosylase I n=1 Tax=Iris pallida TaxID=29817 RepID=A0AAX6FID0_IRIPA|nr:uncharacterized protein M6B38_417350 [Iris pallida]